MQVARVTLKDGFFFYDDQSDGFRERVRNVQANRGTGLEVVDLLEMTEEEYIALGANSELVRMMQPPDQSKEASP